jgi:hypothetical protein
MDHGLVNRHPVRGKSKNRHMNGEPSRLQPPANPLLPIKTCFAVVLSQVCLKHLALAR